MKKSLIFLLIFLIWGSGGAVVKPDSIKTDSSKDSVIVAIPSQSTRSTGVIDTKAKTPTSWSKIKDLFM